MKQKEVLSLMIIGACLIIIALVSWHSVQEIHYLKTFYPRDFTVVEAGWAALVEVMKVALISFPLFLLMHTLRKEHE